MTSRLENGVTLVVMSALAVVLGARLLQVQPDPTQAPATFNSQGDSHPYVTNPEREKPSPPDVPAFQLRTLDGKVITNNDLNGKTVVLNFWATWCGPCRRELPAFDKLYQKYKSDPKVMVLSISIDNREPDRSIADVVNSNHYSFPVLLGSEFATRNSLYIVPTTWFISPEGHKVSEKVGYSEDLEAEFSQRVEAIKTGYTR